jgi:predicted DNA-binding transcriptional regulator AlpA
MKSRQVSKIREIQTALFLAGFRSLDEQAKVLGLSRSTTWSLLKANYKGSGLSASVINRMLASERLPASIRCKILEYIAEKAAGAYGHNKQQRRRFLNRLSCQCAPNKDLRWPDHAA